METLRAQSPEPVDPVAHAREVAKRNAELARKRHESSLGVTTPEVADKTEMSPAPTEPKQQENRTFRNFAERSLPPSDRE